MTEIQPPLNQDNLPDNLHHWEYQSAASIDRSYTTRLYRKYLFESFESAIEFIQQTSHLFISKQNHHPSWKNTYATLEIWLTTHDSKNTVTAKDILLAECLEKHWKEKFCVN